MTDDPGEAWTELFGFPQPYENQRDAVESAIEVGRAGGYLATEGPCGTGKTMAALTAGGTLVRHGEFDTVFVVTPVKQQREQFVDDLRTINAGQDEPLTGVALTGKRDLCPYGREGVFPDDVSVQSRCEDLREATARLVESEDSTDRPAAEAVVDGGADEVWWDPERGADLVKHARPDGAGQQQLATDRLSTAGADSPYPRSQPDAPERTVEGDETPLYCPFEADWYARNKGSPVGFAAGDQSVVTADEYLPRGVEHGTCPHRVMGTLLGEADVVVGNYNHLFDPASRPLVEEILGEETFLVVDEAHRLEERVRELLSGRVGRTTLTRARNDLTTLLSRANQSAEHKTQVRDKLASHDVTLRAVERARDFLDDVVAWLDDRVERYLDREVGPNWRPDAPDSLPARDIEIPLRDPETVERDELTAWAEDADYTGAVWRSLPQVGFAVERVVEALGLTRTPVCGAVGALFGEWYERDHAAYLREIELEHAPKEPGSVATAWQSAYTAGLVLFECMPGDTLREVFDGLGGGVLMSATLEPLSVFEEVSGLASLSASGRPVAERSYELPFPADNRASWVVDATPFTASNRGDPTENQTPAEWNQTRDEYAQILRVLGRSPGNVLVSMPNYREAAWAGEYLKEAIDKPVLVDQSSSNAETDRLKQAFFDGPPAVLVTSTRGTLTEGVDYDGDKLHCCAVVGVPLVNIGSPRVRAIQRAYGDEFGSDNAFEYALTVPAVRRARQAIGRVIRGADEAGVRVFVGRRYTQGARHSVHPFLSPSEQSEFVRMTPEFLEQQFERFWDEHGRPGE